MYDIISVLNNIRDWNMATINFRGTEFTSEEARKMVSELMHELAQKDPVQTENPNGQQIEIVINPAWYTELSAHSPHASLLCIRDPGIGWRGYIMGFDSVAKLVGVFANQMSVRVLNPGVGVDPNQELLKNSEPDNQSQPH